MFTGIIEDLGTVESLKPTDQGAVISVHTSLPISEISIGDSIAVNGACLTVISKSRGTFAMDVSAETLRRTALGDLKPGEPVNLERCLTLDKLLGGHLVSGHVDSVGRVVVDQARRRLETFHLRGRAAQARYLIEKGRSAIDGISLTVFRSAARLFGRADPAHAQVDDARIQTARRHRQYRERHDGEVRRADFGGAGHGDARRGY